ncbi:hypothetical protein ACIQZB_38680 [Streptomyces sp. NPDC097727]|uniref:hypothetical protein n=1 Tax=Streptomyces sp. NPDC097727 TaxID=3366092 RepID=UPI003806322E
MPRPIRITRRLAALAASLAAALATAAAPAAADGSREVALRPEAPATFRMYTADEGVEAANSHVVVPVSVMPGDSGTARTVKVVVDVSGLGGVARAERAAAGTVLARAQ